MSDFLIVRCPACGVKNRIPVEKISLTPKCGKCKSTLPKGINRPVILTDANFDSMIANNDIVLVDFWAPWCGPCKMIAPVIEELAKEFGHKALIAKVNVDENPSVAQRFQIRSIPSLIFFKNGQVFDTIVGAAPAHQIRSKLMAMF